MTTIDGFRVFGFLALVAMYAAGCEEAGEAESLESRAAVELIQTAGADGFVTFVDAGEAYDMVQAIGDQLVV
ncbi:MAG: hypothetical protein AAGJ38_10300, partial [Planctomycetota bacterium]